MIAPVSTSKVPSELNFNSPLNQLRAVAELNYKTETGENYLSATYKIINDHCHARLKLQFVSNSHTEYFAVLARTS